MNTWKAEGASSIAVKYLAILVWERSKSLSKNLTTLLAFNQDLRNNFSRRRESLKYNYMPSMTRSIQKNPSLRFVYILHYILKQGCWIQKGFGNDPPGLAYSIVLKCTGIIDANFIVFLIFCFFLFLFFVSLFTCRFFSSVFKMHMDINVCFTLSSFIEPDLASTSVVLRISRHQTYRSTSQCKYPYYQLALDSTRMLLSRSFCRMDVQFPGNDVERWELECHSQSQLLQYGA